MNQEINLYASLIISSVGIIVAGFLTWQSNIRQKDSIVKDLFREFNKRYSVLNDDLHYVKDNKLSLEALHLDQSNRKYLNSLYDYLDLCAEEYFWYKHKGIIDEVVWKSWRAGMKYWFNNLPALNEIWEYERRNKNHESYYLAADTFFY
jgi:hypothetical protein